MFRRSSRRNRTACAAALGAVLAGWPGVAGAQGPPDDGSAVLAVAGGALGLTSGAILAAAGSLIPCTETLAGARCVRAAAVAGGAIGLLSGALAGAMARERVSGPATSAGIGFLAGSAAGIAIWPIVERFSWLDVVAMGVAGGAIAASPEGAGIGFAAGAAGGLVAMLLDRRNVTIVDALAGAMAGLAIGGLGGWIVRGAQGRAESTILLGRVGL